jgi:spoIIIJ-associated protein
MDNLKLTIQKILELMGFSEFKIDINEANSTGRIFITSDYDLVKNNLNVLVESINYLVNQIARNKNLPFIHFDVNNYRQDREKIIIELAKAAAKKASVTKEEVILPPMNSYERRLVHLELVSHPDVATESVGTGSNRHVVIKPIN